MRIYTSEVTDAYVERSDVGQRGYTIVVWRGRHVAEPTELGGDEAARYWADILRVMRALELHFRPAKMNLFILGNSVPHLHAHLVPRYVDDGEPGAPPRFMKVMEPHASVSEPELRRDAAALRKLLDTTA